MNWFIFFLMFPHLKPGCLAYLWPTVDAAFDWGRIVSALLILYLYLLKRRLPSAPVWVLLALQLWFCITTFINKGELYSVLISSASILAVALLIDLYASQMKMLISSILLNFEWLIYANLLSVFLYFPSGMYIESTHTYRCYFLGYHNGFIMFVLPLILIGIMYWKISGKLLRPSLAITLGVLSIIITWSATSVCFLIVLGAMLLIGVTPLKRVMSFPLIFSVTIAADLSISVFRVMDRIMWITWYIESVLKKQITLTGRTYIWDEFYELFERSPWIGYGSAYHEAAKSSYLADHAHNQWFQMLFMGGIVGLCLFLLLNYLIGKRLMLFSKNPYAYIFLSLFTALYVAFIAEAYTSPLVYILYILAYHIDKFLIYDSSSAVSPSSRTLVRDRQLP